MAGQKQHHVVNKAYLQLFRDPDAENDTTIWMADHALYRVVKSQPVSIAKRAHYYSFKNEAGERSTVLEDFLSEIESAAHPVLLKLSLGETDLTKEQQQYLCFYLAVMFLRVPAFRNTIEDFHRQIVKATMEVIMREPGALEGIARRMGKNEDEIVAENLDDLRAFYQENRAIFQIAIDPVVSLRPIIEQSEGLANILLRMNMRVLENRTWARFITSDNPVSLFNSRAVGSIYGVGFGQEHVEVTFPVSPYFILLFTHGQRHIDDELTPAQVWEMNSRTQGGANRFVFASEHWGALQSLFGLAQTEAIMRKPPWERKGITPKRYDFTPPDKDEDEGRR